MDYVYNVLANIANLPQTGAWHHVDVHYEGVRPVSKRAGNVAEHVIGVGEVHGVASMS